MTANRLSFLESDDTFVDDAFPIVSSQEVDSAHPEIAVLLASMESFNPEGCLSLDRTAMDAYRIGLIPVKELTGRAGSSSAIVTSLDSVLVLPFTWNELLTRLRHGSNPTQSGTQENAVRFGMATADFQRMEAFRSGQQVALTPTQFKVLRYFALNPDRVISREELLNKVWGYNHYPSTRTVDNTVLRLRQALEPVPAEPVHFRTVHGAGYKFIP